MNWQFKILTVGSHTYPLKYIKDKEIKKHGSIRISFRKFLITSISRHECLELLKISSPDKHRNIQKIFSYENDAYGHYLALEHGSNLEEYLTGKNKIDVHELLKLLQQSTDGLKFLHNREIIHKNICPENILVERTEAKIANFGFPESNADTFFVAEEVLNSNQHVQYTKQSDIFALGMVLFYSLLYSKDRANTKKKFQQYTDHLTSKSGSRILCNIEKDFRHICALSVGNQMISDFPDARPNCDVILNDIIFWSKRKIQIFLIKINESWKFLESNENFKEMIQLDKRWDPGHENHFSGTYLDRSHLHGFVEFAVKKIKHYEEKFFTFFKDEHIGFYLNKYPVEIDQVYRISTKILFSDLRSKISEQILKELEEFLPEKVFPMPLMDVSEELTTNEKKLRDDMITKMGIPLKYFIKSTEIQRTCIVLGRGQFTVYEGLLNRGCEKKVAVKMIEKLKYREMEKEIRNLCTQFKNDDNIINFFGLYFENDYYPLVIELAVADFGKFLENENDIYKEHWKKISKKKILYDASNGIMCLHQHQPSIVHLDLKPENILIVDRHGDGNLRACIADFGKSKQTVKKHFVATCTGPQGTPAWYSPEMRKFSEEKKNKDSSLKITIKSDIYQLGLIFGYVIVSKEFHKEEDQKKKKKLLEKYRIEKFHKENFNDHLPEIFILNMIIIKPEERLDAESVVKNPFFWDENKIERFFAQVLADHRGHSSNIKNTKYLDSKAAKKVFRKRTWINILNNENIEKEMKSCRRTSELKDDSYFDLLKFITIVKKDVNGINFPQTRELTNASDPVKFWEFWIHNFEYLLIFGYYDVKVTQNSSEYYSDLATVKIAPRRTLSIDSKFKPPPVPFKKIKLF